MLLSPLVIGLALLTFVGVLFVFMGLARNSDSDLVDKVNRHAATGYAASRIEVAEDAMAAPRKGGLRGLFNSAPAAAFNRSVEGREFGANLARDLSQADLKLRVSEYLSLRVAMILGLPVAAFLLGAVLPAFTYPITWLIALIVGVRLPGMWVGGRKKGRVNSFNRQLPDVIVLIANSLRSGSSFLQACEMVARESGDPAATEFGRVLREVNLGMPFSTALANMVRRIESEDLTLMATAITIQHQVGGNLAEILDQIAFTIRERIRIKGEIQTLTAMQRMSGYVVAALPIGLVGILFVIAPSFMEPMFRNPPSMFGAPMGVVILCAGGFMMFVGFMLIRKIVDIKI